MISELLENTSQDEKNLIQMVKTAYADIQTHCMTTKPIEELPGLLTLTENFKMSAHRAAIFCTAYCIGEKQSRLSDKLLYAVLRNYFNENLSSFRVELREMKRLGLLYRTKNDEGQYQISVQSKFVQALDENDLTAFQTIGPKGLESALEYFKKKVLDHDELTENEICKVIEDIESANQDLNIVKYCNDQMFYFAYANTAALYAICAKAVVDNQSFDFSYMDAFLHFGRKPIQRLRDNILDGSWSPIEAGLVEIEGGNHLEHNPNLRLTSKGYDVLLKELDPDLLKSIRAKIGAIKTPLINSRDINKVSLYFNPPLAEKTKRIAELLSKDSFARYQSQFPKNAKMTGLTVLFHGGPGCGKTEFALQLSRLTGRSLMKVQVTDFQSKWVGESESQLKQIFRDYRVACERLELKPILFLNECDQVLGKRVNISSAVDQMSNSLQNILLEEMENFDGILLGTTNLTQNMDSAFERRWVMKVLFDAPNKAAKLSIWKSAIKGLRASELEVLVDQFDFTPGEIANISRRFSVEKLLGLTQPRLKTLIELCETERLEKQTIKGHHIGFKVA
jgi:hypothetical protein